MIALVMVTSLLVMLLAPAAPELPELSARGTLRALVSADENPSLFNFTQTGEPGFERELLSSFARLHKLQLEPVKVETFADMIPELQRGTGDLIAGIVDTAERRTSVDFTVAVLPSRQLVVTRKPTPAVANVAQLLEQRVGTIRGTTWWSAAVAAGYPAAKLLAFPREDVLFEALRTGKVSAIVTSVTDLTLALRADRDLRPGVMLGEPQSAAWAVRKDDSKLRQALDEYLANVRRTATWSRLVVKYFGEDALAVLGKASMR